MIRYRWTDTVDGHAQCRQAPDIRAFAAFPWGHWRNV